MAQLNFKRKLRPGHRYRTAIYLMSTLHVAPALLTEGS